MKEFVFHHGHYLLAIDGTGYFGSTNISYPHCLEKNRKNDCEPNAVRRLLKLVRTMHPKLKLIVTEDRLSSSGPHIRDLKEMKFEYILGCKLDDHTYLFDNFIKQNDLGLVQSISSVGIGKSLPSETQWLDHLQPTAWVTRAKLEMPSSRHHAWCE